MKETLDRAISQLALRQRGYVTRRQLLDLGLGAGAIRYRLRIGRLIQVYPGVYAVGHLPVSLVDRAATAVLACGPDAALSHFSALCLWGWHKSWAVPFDVTAPERHRRPGIRSHQSPGLTRRDVSKHLGIRVTSPARTLLDVTPTLNDNALRRTVREARLSPYLQIADLADVLGRFPEHRGAERLRTFLPPPDAPTRSEFEDAFMLFCERFGLPRPKVNVRIGRYVVDALFASERLIVELDGYDYHGDRESFEGDRDRDASNLLAGFGTVRVTWARMIVTPQVEADRLLAILRMRRR